MKKLYSLLALCLFITGNAQIINFPDANFKAKLLAANSTPMQNQIAKDLSGNYIKIDANSNGEIEVSEAMNISYLYLCNSPYISSMVGITNFANLEYLNCGVNYITALDLSGLTNLKELVCGYNGITSLDLTGLTSLESLRCDFNGMTTLNISGLLNLKTIDCSHNEITSLNVSGLTGLQTLICSYNQLSSLNLNSATNLQKIECYGNLLPSIDLAGLTNLTELLCAGNQLTTLDVNGLTNLQNLICTQNQISSLDINGLNNLKYLYCDYNQMTSLNMSGLISLNTLKCDNNQLSSLNVSGFNSLYDLDCNTNQINSLQVSGLSNLGILKCGTNQLASLNLNGLNSLTSLSCGTNLLTTLDLSSLTNLTNLLCEYNQLTTLDLTSVINLNYLTCYYNSLTSLDLTGLINLVDFACENNQLTSIDISPCTNLNTLFCYNNQLSTLFMKNGKKIEEYNLNFSDNPNLEYICGDDIEIMEIQDKISEYSYTNCHVNSYCTFVPGGTYYTIQGNQKFDNDNNGCDISDIVYPNLKLSFSDGTNTGNLICDTTGNYKYDVQAGTHTITPTLENPSYFTIFPSTSTATFPTQTSPLTQNFCITANGAHPDLEITLLPISQARPGFDANYKIIYKNKGNQTQSGSVNVMFDDAVLDFVSANPATTIQATNSLSWDYSNLLPFETREIILTLNVNAPTDIPAVNNGDILDYTATVTSPATDETPIDNTFTFHQTVVGSHDPNDKTCLEGTTITPAMVGEYVHYVIRFENTGTFPAQNIVVKDMIDLAKFDINTLIPIKGSHEFITKISDTNKVEFIFENINLPFDDANNDGFVAFKIKTKSSLVVGDTFSNSANIYFDYNFPIVTNTATTTVQTLENSDFEFAKYFTVYPNPAYSTLNLSVKSGVSVSSIAIYNTLGQLVIAVPNAQSVSSIDVSSLKTGNYFIKMVTDKGSSNTKFVKD